MLFAPSVTYSYILTSYFSTFVTIFVTLTSLVSYFKKAPSGELASIPLTEGYIKTEVFSFNI